MFQATLQFSYILRIFRSFRLYYSSVTFFVSSDVSGYTTVQLHSSYLSMFQATIQFSYILRIFICFRLHYSSVTFFVSFDVSGYTTVVTFFVSFDVSGYTKVQLHSSYLSMFPATLQFSYILRIFRCFRLHYSSVTFFVSLDVSCYTTVQLHSSYL